MSDSDELREMTQPLTGGATDYDSLLELIGDARFVLLGEPLEHTSVWEAGELPETYPSGV
jgi:hypothetical protein